MRMRFCVNVPVLSAHSTVAAPSVSMVAARRVSTRAFEMRHAPITMNTLSTSGNSSGSIDMPSAMPASSAFIQPSRSRPYSSTASALSVTPARPNARTTCRVCRLSRVGSCVMRPSAAPMRPISLRGPVAVTQARPRPRTTSVPE
uniref:Secreted protein n=1 Tax=Mizugakiibacter sediminis TaxID=1475481 RepID=A0A0S6Z011_9GAMM